MDDGGRTAPKLRHPPVWPRRAVLWPGGAAGRDQGAREVNRTWRLLLRLRSAAQAEEEATATRACSFGGGLGPSRGPGGTLPAPPAIVVGRRTKGLLGDPCPTATLSLLRPTPPGQWTAQHRCRACGHDWEEATEAPTSRHTFDGSALPPKDAGPQLQKHPRGCRSGRQEQAHITPRRAGCRRVRSADLGQARGRRIDVLSACRTRAIGIRRSLCRQSPEAG